MSVLFALSRTSSLQVCQSRKTGEFGLSLTFTQLLNQSFSERLLSSTEIQLLSSHGFPSSRANLLWRPVGRFLVRLLFCKFEADGNWMVGWGGWRRRVCVLSSHVALPSTVFENAFILAHAASSSSRLPYLQALMRHALHLSTSLMHVRTRTACFFRSFFVSHQAVKCEEGP